MRILSAGVLIAAALFLAGYSQEQATPKVWKTPLPESTVMPAIPFRSLLSDLLNLHMEAAYRRGDDDEVHSDMNTLLAMFPDRDLDRIHFASWMALDVVRVVGHGEVSQRWVDRAFRLMEDGLETRRTSAPLHHCFGMLIYLKATAQDAAMDSWLQNRFEVDPFVVSQRHLFRAVGLDPTDTDFRSSLFVVSLICGKRAIESQDADGGVEFFSDARRSCRPEDRRDLDDFVALAKSLAAFQKAPKGSAEAAGFMDEAFRIHRILQEGDNKLIVPSLSSWIK